MSSFEPVDVLSFILLLLGRTTLDRGVLSLQVASGTFLICLVMMVVVMLLGLFLLLFLDFNLHVAEGVLSFLLGDSSAMVMSANGFLLSLLLQFLGHSEAADELVELFLAHVSKLIDGHNERHLPFQRVVDLNHLVVLPKVLKPVICLILGSVGFSELSNKLDVSTGHLIRLLTQEEWAVVGSCGAENIQGCKGCKAYYSEEECKEGSFLHRFLVILL